MKKYEILWKFSDVITEIEAESLDEAIKLAEISDAPKEDTYCYGTEVEEIKTTEQEEASENISNILAKQKQKERGFKIE